MKKLAIVASHPIQYNAPWFRMLASRNNILLKVFYTWHQSQYGGKFDPGFGKAVEWDIPLLEGYDYVFVNNISKDPGSHHYRGLINPTLISEIEEWKADALLVITWAHHSHLACMRHFHKKIPILFRGDSTLLNEQLGIKKIIRTLFLKWVYSHVDYGIYVGTNNRAYYRRHGLGPSQLVFAPHAIDNNRFTLHEQENKAKALAWRNEIGISASDLVFLYAGKLEPVKNIELLAAAFSKIKLPQFHLVLVGNGINEKDLKKDYSTVPNLHFLDFQNQSLMPVVYHLCDVFVLPSRSETWGLAINEAMACRKAVLVSDKCGSAIDLVHEGKNGCIFKSEDLESLVSKLNYLVNAQGSLEEFGNVSFEMIVDYNFTNICIAVENILNKEKLNSEI